MEWTTEGVDRLGDALDESTIFGLTGDLEARVCRLLLEVNSLPEVGPLDPDPRRVLLLSGVSSIVVMLRRAPIASDDAYGPAIDVASLDGLNAFFGSLTMIEAMYGWDFIDDDEDPTRDWADEPSLTLVLDESPAEHQLYWFTDCSATDADGESTPYFLQGLVRFKAVAFQRADGSAIGLAELVEDSNRWWRALFAHDPRVSLEAQRAGGEVAQSWRSDRVASTTRVTGTPAASRG